jgi:hypothetical protein
LLDLLDEVGARARIGQHQVGSLADDRLGAHVQSAQFGQACDGVREIREVVSGDDAAACADGAGDFGCARLQADDALRRRRKGGSRGRDRRSA